MAKLTLDLHPIFNRGAQIEQELERVIDEAERKKITTVEIIPGKGSGQLKKRVLRFLDRKDIKQRYHRLDKDRNNHGRLFVYFRFRSGQ
ncbi:Smr domain-containing protein [Halospina denitrificans]|uniref:Smr domain-containing protein n=1 Tax=Halospina denitrificans TaxID=332522 RepID=A0A4V3ERD3_9GAMM|nr:Smr/MutS family protein [Halospina denitrificans]TDT42988.1 Smr domain-containing protein [Halospina denitrificans]